MNGAAASRQLALVTVQHLGPTGRIITQRDLRTRSQLTFADCHSNCCVHDLTTPGIAGEVAVHHNHYTLTNLSRAAPLRVWDLERPTQHILFEPQHGPTPIPFIFAGIGALTSHTLTIHGFEASSPSRSLCATAKDTPTLPLDRASFEYRVLYALCRRRLHGGYGSPLPTAAEIGEGLNVSAELVRRAISRLARHFDIPPPDNPRTGWMTYAVAHFALTHGVITGPPLRAAKRTAELGASQYKARSTQANRAIAADISPRRDRRPG
jgi:hypothetical protein